MTSTWGKWPILRLLEPEFILKIRMILIFGDSGDSCIIVTQDQTVYGIGNNSVGRLGTGNSKSTLHPTKIDELCGKNIKTFAYGSEHLLALTKKGEVYAWGGNKYMQLGYCDGSSTPKKVQIGEAATDFVVDIACGSNHSVALTNDGLVYAWGNDTANDPRYYDYYNESAINGIERVKLNTKKIKCVSISCGTWHSMAVTNKGQVYGWGKNSLGQLGNGTINDSYISQPSKVINLNGIVIVKVVCGMNHNLALSDKGSLYSWGDNQQGQLGIASTSRRSSTPLNVLSLKDVCDVAASYNNNISVAVGEGHKIFVWGECAGQIITNPKLISLDSIDAAFAIYASRSNMHKPFFLSDNDTKKNEPMHVLNNLEAAFDDKNTSDLTIEVQGKTIYVHKAILRIRSHYFKRMFDGHWKENNDSVVKEGQFCYVVYRAFLKFLYTGKIDIPAENAMELFHLADFCNDNHLKACCDDVIMQGITTDNAVFIYCVAVKYNAMALKERCIKFAVENMTRVIGSTSFAELSHEMMKTFITEANEFKVFKT